MILRETHSPWFRLAEGKQAGFFCVCLWSLHWERGGKARGSRRADVLVLEKLHQRTLWGKPGSSVSKAHLWRGGTAGCMGDLLLCVDPPGWTEPRWFWICGAWLFKCLMLLTGIRWNIKCLMSLKKPAKLCSVKLTVCCSTKPGNLCFIANWSTLSQYCSLSWFSCFMSCYNRTNNAGYVRTRTTCL